MCCFIYFYVYNSFSLVLKKDFFILLVLEYIKAYTDFHK